MQQQTANATAIREHIFSLVFNSIQNPGAVARFNLLRTAPRKPATHLVHAPVSTGFNNEAGVGVWRCAGQVRPLALAWLPL